MTKLLTALFLIPILLAFLQTDKRLKFEKIIFHTSMCYGTCPSYHLEVDHDKRIKLYAEQVYNKTRDLESYVDSTKMGYFSGEVSDTAFIKLINELQSIGLDSLKFNGVNCCDGSLKTIIIYYNGQRKFLQSMFPPKNASKLISTLYEICRTSQLQRSDKRLEIENE